MKRKTIPVGLYEANCTILWDETGRALVVDPGDEAARILDFLGSAGLKPTAVFLTHGHFDHISGVDGILSKHAVPVYLHADDVELAFSRFNTSQPGYPGMARSPLLDTSLVDGAALPGWPNARVLHTPGHSPGSCCLFFPDDALLIAGDVLFAGSVGRTDLPGGSWPILAASLARLAALPGETAVVCGHGPSTTITDERAGNPFLRDLV